MRCRPPLVGVVVEDALRDDVVHRQVQRRVDRDAVEQDLFVTAAERGGEVRVVRQQQHVPSDVVGGVQRIQRHIIEDSIGGREQPGSSRLRTHRPEVSPSVAAAGEGFDATHQMGLTATAYREDTSRQPTRRLSWL